MQARVAWISGVGVGGGDDWVNCSVHTCSRTRVDARGGTQSVQAPAVRAKGAEEGTLEPPQASQGQTNPGQTSQGHGHQGHGHQGQVDTTYPQRTCTRTA